MNEIGFLGIGIFIGILLGAGGVVLYNIFFTKRIQNTDLSNFSGDFKNLKDILGEMKTDSAKHKGALNQILSDVRLSEQQIAEAIRESKTTLISSGVKQGAWGQMVLEYILKEKLQFTEGEEFSTQKLYETEDGKLIPDVIVHFPDDRDVVVDSKVSLTAWDQYVNAKDEEIKKNALNEHRKSIKSHIDSLAKKNYQKIKEINSLDTVIMFCPNEPAISSLGEISRNMMDYAISKKVTLVGPSMLYFSLKTVEYYWKSEKQRKNIQTVIDLADKATSQANEIYESAQSAKDGAQESIEKIDEVLKKMKDGKGSFLSRILKMIKIGGLSPKTPVSKEVKEDIEMEEAQSIQTKGKNGNE